ncbi:hypothetical protein EHQ10_00330 [Leptospira bouyouniensis]|uniref:HTH cro/C1-type domain-containing protein n=2 Tax=Leptospira bouyouniensis TaxID=2484911 RepID=A0ABY2L9R0_9LEPT|nr:hypothetical protein EHQ10_00330 [Leptospira bouyouniensis]
MLSGENVHLNGQMKLIREKAELIRRIQAKMKTDGRTIRQLAADTNLSKSQIHKLVVDEHPNVSLDHVLIVCQELRIPYELIYKP